VGSSWLSERVANLMEAQYGTLWQLDDQLQLSADRLDIAAQGGQMHVGLLLDLRN